MMFSFRYQGELFVDVPFAIFDEGDAQRLFQHFLAALCDLDPFVGFLLFDGLSLVVPRQPGRSLLWPVEQFHMGEPQGRERVGIHHQSGMQFEAVGTIGVVRAAQPALGHQPPLMGLQIHFAGVLYAQQMAPCAQAFHAVCRFGHKFCFLHIGVVQKAIVRSLLGVVRRQAPDARARGQGQFSPQLMASSYKAGIPDKTRVVHYKTFTAHRLTFGKATSEMCTHGSYRRQAFAQAALVRSNDVNAIFAAMPSVLDVALTPAGRWRVLWPEGHTATAATDRLDPAFDRSSADGVLALLSWKGDLSHGAAWLQQVVLGLLARLSHCSLEGDGLPPIMEATGMESHLLSAPPIRGGEYLSTDLLAALFDEVQALVRERMRVHADGAMACLRSLHSSLHTLGSVSFHLAENPRDPVRPFAFMASYAARLSTTGSVQHLPLGQALKQFTGSDGKPDAKGLRRLLEPVHIAAQASPLAKQLLDTGALFAPQAWGATEAHAFLQDAPLLENAGLQVRLPNWWATRPQARAKATIGKKPGLGIGGIRGSGHYGGGGKRAAGTYRNQRAQDLRTGGAARHQGFRRGGARHSAPAGDGRACAWANGA